MRANNAAQVQLHSRKDTAPHTHTLIHTHSHDQPTKKKKYQTKNVCDHRAVKRALFVASCAAQ